MTYRTKEVAKFVTKGDMGEESEIVYPAVGARDRGDLWDGESVDIQKSLEKGFQLPQAMKSWGRVLVSHHVSLRRKETY